MPSPNAVILCAGRGTRYAGRGNEEPKCLLDLGKESILERQVRLLRVNKIDDITVVVSSHPKLSHLRDKIISESIYLGIKVFILDINTPLNQYPDNVFSFINSKHLYNDTIVILGDTIFSDTVFKQVLNEPFRDVMFVRNNIGRKEIFMVLLHECGLKYLNFKPKSWRNFKLKDFRMFSSPLTKDFYPNGFIRDVDYPEDLISAKRILKEEAR